MESSKGKLSSKNQQSSHVKVVTSWTYINEPNPAFKRLMMLLVKSNSARAENTSSVGGELNEQN